MLLNLQTVMVVIGAVIVLAIYLASKWQHRAHRTALRGDDGRDIQLTPDGMDAPDEFANAAGPAFTPPTVTPDGDRDEDGDENEHDRPNEPTVTPTDDPTVTNHDDHTAHAPQLQTATGFHNRHIAGFEKLSQIDYWAKITGARDVGRESVLALYREGADFSKAHGIHGVKAPGMVWCDLESEAEDSRFADLVVTVQLADRDGAIDERELTRFATLCARVADGTGRESAPMASVDNALAQADALAAFVRHFDATFVVTIHPHVDPHAESHDGDSDSDAPHTVSGTFGGDAIDRIAAQVGMERDDNRHYSRFKSVGRGARVVLYNLADLTDDGQFDFDELKSFRSRGLAFFMRPAVNHSPGAVFAEMADTAKAFAARIKGEARVPNHDEFTREEIDTIRKSIEREAAEMAKLGIPAGGAEAMRLFN